MTCRYAVPLVAVVLLASGCGGASPGSSTGVDPAGSSTASAGISGEVTVLAAASLTAPLTALAQTYEAARPSVTVRLGFGSSTTLARQVAQGADADLLATAGTAPLDHLGDLEPDETMTMARNTLEIATPPGNPARVGGLADLARTHVQVVLCATSVPCGAAADGVLARAAVRANVVSREVDVNATLAKVRLGEADAAVVYHSDVVSAGVDVLGVEIPPEQNTILDYPLLRFGDDPAARDFAAYLAGPEARTALAAAGFLAP